MQISGLSPHVKHLRKITKYPHLRTIAEIAGAAVLLDSGVTRSRAATSDRAQSRVVPC